MRKSLMDLEMQDQGRLRHLVLRTVSEELVKSPALVIHLL
jgi:hypothetical protein